VGRKNVVPERARRFKRQQSARGSVRHPLRSGRVIETGVNKPSYMADIEIPVIIKKCLVGGYRKWPGVSACGKSPKCRAY
jgi:hypothetical protein